MGGDAPKRIGEYEVERELGQGGMGRLYVARQPVLERPAVLKALRRDLAEDPRQIERFRREAQTAARIHHPNVVAVYDCFDYRGQLFLAQEFVDGADLATLLVRGEPLPARIAAQVALEVARGLEEIHGQGIVHRDLKPANILLSRHGEVKIADFGIALPDHAPALTRIGSAIGTAPYMAPEQLLGDRVDERSDSFAFGLLVYELLTKCRPFAGEDAESEAALLRSIQSGRYLRVRRRAPHTPRWLGRTIERCLRASPQRRPTLPELRRELERRVPSADPRHCRHALADWLEQTNLLEGDPNATRLKPNAVLRHTPRWSAFGRRAWVTAAASVALLASGIGGMLFVRERPLPSLQRFTTESLRLTPAPTAAVPSKAEHAEPPRAEVTEKRAERTDEPRAEKLQRRVEKPEPTKAEKAERRVEKSLPAKSEKRSEPAKATKKSEKTAPARSQPTRSARKPTRSRP